MGFLAATNVNSENINTHINILHISYFLANYNQ